tara:strand:- start:129472 stop:130563 length:1092 start_codon:yes stop_codon:yes gene_type:complete
MSKNIKYIGSFNGLRFLAASYVIAFHYFSFENAPLLKSFIRKGHIAVPFFFLLSGFVLSYSYQNYDFSTFSKKMKYIKSRFIRLAPIYYMAMALSAPFIYLNYRNGLHYSSIEFLSYLTSHLTLTQNLYPTMKHLIFWNYHSWSLSVEMFLYVLSPFIILKFKTMKHSKLITSYFLLVLLNLIIFLSMIYYPQVMTPYRSIFSPLFIPTFCIGAVMANIYTRYILIHEEKFNKGLTISFIFSAILLIISFLLPLPEIFYSTYNPFYTLGFSILIISSTSKSMATNWLGSSTLILLGDASYAMYIFQAPIKTATYQFLSKVLNYQISSGFLYCLSVFSAITIFSVVITKYVDPKLRLWLRKKLL